MSNSILAAQELKQFVLSVAQRNFTINGTFDNVVTGVIKGIRNETYDIELSESTGSYSALPLTDKKYNINDRVFIIKSTSTGLNTNGTYYYIFGLVDATSKEFINASEWERFSTKDGAVSELSGGSFKENFNTEADGIYEGSAAGFFMTEIQKTGTFSISGEFKTNNIFNISNYGLKIELVKRTIDDVVIDTFIWDTKDLVGNPFNYASFTKQRFLCKKNPAISWDGVNVIKISSFYTGNFNNSDSNIELLNLTLQAGSLLEVNSRFTATISAQDGKDYFSFGTNKNNIKMNASAYIDSSLEKTDSMQYFWFVKTEEEDQEIQQYFSFLKDSYWHCLNDVEEVSLKISDENTVLVKKWLSGADQLILESDNANLMNYFSKFKNSIICAIKYQGAIAITDEFEILNFNKSNFSAVLHSNDSSNKLVHEQDTIVYTCEVLNENENFTAGEFRYNWKVTYVSPEINENITTFYKNANNNKIIIKDSLSQEDNNEAGFIEKNDTLYFEIPKGVKNISLGCSVDMEDDGKYVEIAVISPETEITTYVFNTEFITINTYKVITSKSSDLSFAKIVDNSENKGWDGIWNVSGDGGYERLTFEGDPPTNEDDLRAELDNHKPEESADGGQSPTIYIYYTFREEWYEKTGDEIASTPLKTEDWTKPKIFDIWYYSSDGNYKLSGVDSAAMLNTFRELSENGSQKGVYIKKNENTGKDEVYINADFIRSGVLEVINKNNKPLFSAGLTGGTVKIAGWDVDEDSLYANNNTSGIASLPTGETKIDLNKLAFWAGNTEGSRESSLFRVYHNGTLHATKANIEGSIQATSLKIFNTEDNVFVDIDKYISLKAGKSLFTMDSDSGIITITAKTNDDKSALLSLDGNVQIVSRDSNNVEVFKLTQQGEVTAKKGIVGGWGLTEYIFYSSHKSYTFGDYTIGDITLCPSGHYDGNLNNSLSRIPVIFAGISHVNPSTLHQAAESARFRVDSDGRLFAVAGQIGGWNLRTNCLLGYNQNETNNKYENTGLCSDPKTKYCFFAGLETDNSLDNVDDEIINTAILRITHEGKIFSRNKDSTVFIEMGSDVGFLVKNDTGDSISLLTNNQGSALQFNEMAVGSVSLGIYDKAFQILTENNITPSAPLKMRLIVSDIIIQDEAGSGGDKFVTKKIQGTCMVTSNGYIEGIYITNKGVPFYLSAGDIKNYLLYDDYPWMGVAMINGLHYYLEWKDGVFYTTYSGSQLNGVPISIYY